MPSTIRDLNELTAPVAADFLAASDTSDTVDRDKKLALGKFPLKGGTPVAGRVASWTDGDFLQDAGFLASAVAQKSGTPTANRVASWLNATTVQDAGFLASLVALIDGSRVIKNLVVGGSAGLHAPKVEATLKTDAGTSIGARFFMRNLYLLNAGGWLYPIDDTYLVAYFIVAGYEEGANGNGVGTLTVRGWGTPATLVCGTVTLTFSLSTNLLMVQKSAGAGVHLAVIGVSI